jgi:hypothetical protein
MATIGNSGKRGWARRHRWALALATAGLAVTAWLGVRYGNHLHWRLATAFDGRRSVQPLPVSPMPVAGVPEAWDRCRFGCLSIAVPPGVAAKREVRTAKSGALILVLGGGGRQLIVTGARAEGEPFGAREFSQLGCAIPPAGQRLSRVRLRLAVYRVAYGDFRWSMSREELRWYCWRVTAAPLLRLGAGDRAEYILRDDIEGILNLGCGPATASFDWEAPSDGRGGSLVFVDHSASPEVAWMRAVCQSLALVRSGSEKEGKKGP